jgi:hypothetical protein
MSNLSARLAASNDGDLWWLDPTDEVRRPPPLTSSSSSDDLLL